MKRKLPAEHLEVCLLSHLCTCQKTAGLLLIFTALYLAVMPINHVKKRPTKLQWSCRNRCALLHIFKKIKHSFSLCSFLSYSVFLTQNGLSEADWLKFYITIRVIFFSPLALAKNILGGTKNSSLQENPCTTIAVIILLNTSALSKRRNSNLTPCKNLALTLTERVCCASL